MQTELIVLGRPANRSYRWDERTLERLDKLAAMLPTKTETALLTDAIADFLSRLERDEAIHLTVPSEVTPNGRRRHKRPDDAA